MPTNPPKFLKLKLPFTTKLKMSKIVTPREILKADLIT